METNEIKDFWASRHTKSVFEFTSSIHTQCVRITCADGFRMSVQPSYAHYCSPRLYLEDGDYSAWEIGFPTQKEELIMPFVEDEERPTDTVYGYVPTDIVNQVIRKHGGIHPAAIVA